jgi:hypothetical protein
MKRFASVFVLAILFAMTTTWTCLLAAGQSKDNAEDETAELKKLQKEQIATLTKRVDIITRQEQAAGVDVTQLFLAQMELCDAKLDAADTPEERIAVLEEQLKVAESAQKVTELRYSVAAASTTQAEVLSAKSLCLKIKIKLVRERGKQKAKLGLQGNSPQDAVPPAGAQKFEYKTILWGGGGDISLSALGAQGWEMCGVVPEQPTANTIVIFKRPKQ